MAIDQQHVSGPSIHVIAEELMMALTNQGVRNLLRSGVECFKAVKCCHLTMFLFTERPPLIVV